MNVAELIHASLRIPSQFPAPVTVEAAEDEGHLIFLRVRTQNGSLHEVFLTREEIASALEAGRAERPAVVPGDHQFLLVEAERIRLAYAYDPHFAVSLSGVEPLPHQLEAVYERMLPQARLRYLLADDPGAGKTIMAGLLIKELKMRQAIERVLVLCPAPLTIQWQDEMRAKFDETFEIVRAENAKDQLAGNVWQRFSQVIASVDFAKRDEVSVDLLRSEWDLVIVDEAHKCAARWTGSEVKRTKRYSLIETLGELAERLVLLTATPHSGSPEQFAYFLRLLDSDQFVGPDRVDNYAELNYQALIPKDAAMHSPWFLRRVKEDLRDFEGQKLFTHRNAITVPFELSDAERQLYLAVTDYINQYLPRQMAGRKKAPIALARTVLQRRLASSVRAIRRSLERRFERFGTILREVEALPLAKQEAYLRNQNLLESFDDEQDEDDADEFTREAAIATIYAAERISELRQEVDALRALVEQARRLERMGDERKLTALLNCLQRAEFAELKDGRGKLLIFTEHKDTLDYLKERLDDTYTVEIIHGGMAPGARKDAQERFRKSAQVCVATDAAGEGINLQFCHLMINYDMPWNPMRLEQRMGRIHRIGQKLDVFIFNFVAQNTVEGRVLERLLHKLEIIRSQMGDRVFDVIGTLLRLNGVDLEDILREAATNPRSISDEYYLRQIEQISPERLAELEKATGVAMATSHVDLGRIQTQDYRSEERRLMPEYVEQFFLNAAAQLKLPVDQRADGLYRVEHVPQKLRANTLPSVRRFGAPADSYRKLTFRKRDILDNPSHADADLLSPGHPLFAAVADQLTATFAPDRGGLAAYVDASATESYRIHFFTAELVGEEPAPGGTRQVLQHAALCAVIETDDGLELAPPDILHDLEPVNDADSADPIPATARQQIERFVRGKFQYELMNEQRQRREREIDIRRQYLESTFDAIKRAYERKALEFGALVESGHVQYRLARDEAWRNADQVEARMRDKLDALKLLRVLRPGAVGYLGSAEVRPAHVERADTDAIHRDPAVEMRAMQFFMDYERAQGRTPTDVSKLNDASGFDIRSEWRTPDGRREVRRIEVKGRSGYNQPVALTTNEWLQARRHGYTFWLYVVWGCGQGQTPQLLTIPNPASTLRDHAAPVIKHYLIPADPLGKAAFDA
ncbi:MAG: DUF3883 domain-containing protein [Burkholderiaceae bacterium]|nr:DUF3883 domain-containing protein [Burkholderiaceae bacterium]